jgi:hypothetical protein
MNVRTLIYIALCIGIVCMFAPRDPSFDIVIGITQISVGIVVLCAYGYLWLNDSSLE